MLVETAMMAPLGLFELIGVAGAALYVGNYTRLVTRRASADRPGYFVVNLAAALLLLISLSQAFNLGAVLIQAFFCVMSLVGIVSRVRPLRQRRQRSAAPIPQPIRWTCPGAVAKQPRAGSRGF